MSVDKTVLYCRSCGAKLVKQPGEWTINGERFVLYYCPTAGPVEVDSDGWIVDTQNKGHYYEMVSEKE